MTDYNIKQQEMERRYKLLLMENEQLKNNLRYKDIQQWKTISKNHIEQAENDSPNPPLRKEKNLLGVDNDTTNA
jgi:hypothetical protein